MLLGIDNHADARRAHLIFNRQDTTRKLLRRSCAPSAVYAARRGRRPEAHVSSDEERCAETRALIDGVDWVCDVRRHYADANMGLADRVAA